MGYGSTMLPCIVKTSRNSRLVKRYTGDIIQCSNASISGERTDVGGVAVDEHIVTVA